MPGRLHKSYQRSSSSDLAGTATGQRSGKVVKISADTRWLSSGRPASFGSALRWYSAMASLVHGASSPAA